MRLSTDPTRFWQRWVVANALGELIGLGTVAAIGFLVFQHADEATTTGEALAFGAVFALLGAFEGLVIGLAQWHVLRSILPFVRGWVFATIVGAFVAWVIGMIPSAVFSLMSQGDTGAQVEPPLALVLFLAAGLGAVAGPLLAAFQWLSLRKVLSARAWLWLPANALAWTFGMPIIFLGAQSNEVTSSVIVVAALVALAILVAGAVVGAVHGRILMYMVERGGSVKNAA
jgi:hypothetical protein